MKETTLQDDGMAIRLITLGGLRGSRDGAELRALVSRELSAALLVHVAVERETTRDRLMALLWPDQDTATARRRLSQMLYSLRQTLGEECIEARGRQVLAGACLEVDALDFERAIEEGRVDDGVTAYGGPFLEGVHLAGTSGFEGWVDGNRARYSRLFRRACRAAVESKRKSGDLNGAIATARAWVAPDPLDDEAQHQLIDLLAHAGERSEALRQYAAYEGLLEADGLQPLDETKELIQRIRQGPPLAHPRGGRDGEPDLDARVRSGLAPDLEVLRTLGHGSTAAVYLARETALRRFVAVKVLLPELAGDDTARQRFEREAWSAASVVHPNVAQVFRVAGVNGLPCIIMQFIDGRTLSDTLAARGPLTPAETREIVRGVASALAAAHDRGIVHRDVRPANIFLENRTGRPVLTDFGIAALIDSSSSTAPKLTPIGIRVGDVRYMSPERVLGEPVTELSDVYALGIVAWETLTGEHPLRARLPEQMMAAHIRQEPRPLATLLPGIDSALASVIDRCLAKVPAHRPRAGDVVKMLAD